MSNVKFQEFSQTKNQMMYDPEWLHPQVHAQAQIEGVENAVSVRIKDYLRKH